MSWSFFVRHYESDEQQQRDSKYCAKRGGVFYPRAGTLGGCTAHNAMILVCSEQPGLGRDRRRDRRRVLARRRTCGGTSSGSRTAGTGRSDGCCSERLGWNPSRHGFDGWLATSQAEPEARARRRRLVRIVKASALTALIAALASVRAAQVVLHDVVRSRTTGASVCAGLEGTRLTPLSHAAGSGSARASCCSRCSSSTPTGSRSGPARSPRASLFDDDNARVGVEYLEGGAPLPRRSAVRRGVSRRCCGTSGPRAR